MKRSASRDLQKKEKTKKVDHANDAIPIVVAQGDELQDLVAGWADNNQERTGRWMKAMREQDIETMQALQELSSDEAGWDQLIVNLRATQNMLATKLKIWKAQEGMFRFALLDFPTCFLTCPFLQNSDTHT